MLLKKKNKPEYITDDMDIFSHSDKEDSDEENYNENLSDENNFDEKH